MLTCTIAFSGSAAIASAALVYGVQTDRIIRFDPADPNATFAVLVNSSTFFGGFPQGIDFGPDGNLYVCQSSTSAFYRINPQTGAVTTLASLQKPAGTAGFFQDLALDPTNGEMFTLLSDPSNRQHRVLKINLANSTSTDLGLITGLPSPGNAFADGLTIGSDGVKRLTYRVGSGSRVYALGGPTGLDAVALPDAGTSLIINGLGTNRAGFPDSNLDTIYAATDNGISVLTPTGALGSTIWGGGRVWDLAVSPVPAPATAGALALGACLMPQRRRRADDRR